MISFINKDTALQYTAFKEKWRRCRRCPLLLDRTKIVHVSGRLPCDLLFVGEAPGESEDIIGEPFVGTTGDELREMLSEASSESKVNTGRLRIAYINVVACRPTKIVENNKENRPPKAIEIDNCAERTAQLYRICQGQYRRVKLVALLGKSAASFEDILRLDPLTRQPNVVQLIHPSAILRSRQNVDRTRFILKLAAALKQTYAKAFPKQKV